MRLHEKTGNKSAKMLTSEEVLIKHPFATRCWFIDSRKRSKKALKMNAKQIMDLCDWYEQDGQLYCRSKKTGKKLVWNDPMSTWTDVTG